MFRVSLANAFAKRSLRPLHEKHQATPVNVLLLGTETAVYSGQPAQLNNDGTVSRYANSNTGPCWGLFALDKNDTIDDTNGQPDDLGGSTNGTPFAIWQGGPDAYFRVTEPDPVNGHYVFINGASFAVGDVVEAVNTGRLDDSSGTGVVIGRVVEVISDANQDYVIQLNAPTA